MIKSTVDFDAIMVKILNCILSGDNDCTDLFTQLGEMDTGDAFAECISRGYIDGMSCSKDSSGIYGLSREPYIRVTYRGLQFLENNSHYN